jgi:hypothetical protein
MTEALELHTLTSLPVSKTSISDRVTSALVEMETREFINLESHPRQRDTERHAAKALKAHLQAPSPTHRHVAAAQFRDEFYKLDGHTRSYLWGQNLLKPPRTVFVTIYKCESYQDMLELYSHFDNAAAAETTADRMFGAFREHGFALQSPVLKKANFSVAMAIARSALEDVGRIVHCSTDPRFKNIYENVALFAPELARIDLMNLSNRRMFTGGVFAGMLIALRKHGEKIVPFFEAYDKNLGEKSAKECDPVYALREMVLNGRKYSGGWRHAEVYCGRTLSAVDAYVRCSTYKLGPKGGVSMGTTKYAGSLIGRRSPFA